MLKELKRGLREGVYPGAALLVAHGGENIFFEAVGHRLLFPEAFPMHRDTIFDLASLTKPLATSLAFMKLVDEESLHLDQPLVSLLPGDIPKDKQALTPRLLLSHSAGLSDWQPFYLKLAPFSIEKRKAIMREELLRLPLVYRPGEGVLYSDLGFMLLEWIIEESGGIPMHLFLDQHFYQPMSLNYTFLDEINFHSRFAEDRFAATEDCAWRKKIILGHAQDENACALGGYSGHAGLFGVAEEIYVVLNLLREHFRGKRSDFFKTETVRTFFRRQCIVNSSPWALGWDTPTPGNSSSGKYFSRNSVGHLGFTGPSIWMDLEQDVIVIFLTNRIHPTRKNEKIKGFRPRIHDLIMEELGLGGK